MKHTYKITGMTCESCVEKVTNALLAIENITSVSVSKKYGTADIAMKSHVQTSTMQDVLKTVGSYGISMDMNAADGLLKQKYTFKDFLPLILIFTIIIVFTVLMTLFVGNGDIMFGMRMMMGGFFAIFGVLKVFNLKHFVPAYQTYDILAKRSKAYAYSYPFIELLLAIAYFANIGGIIRDAFTLVLMLVSAIGVFIKLKQKETTPCACLGMVFVLPMTWVTLVEDLIMVVMASLMIIGV